MTDVKTLEKKAKPMSKVPELENSLNLLKHMAEYFYMFSGERVSVEIKTTPGMMSELVDWFGTDFSVVKKGEDSIVVRVKCNCSAMRFWALQYGSLYEKKERDAFVEQVLHMLKKFKLYVNQLANRGDKHV